MTEQASNVAFQVSSTALPDLNGSEQVGSGTKQVCKTAPQPERCRRTGFAPVSNFKKLCLEAFFAATGSGDRSVAAG
jgi:hypothetical protein